MTKESFPEGHNILLDKYGFTYETILEGRRIIAEEIKKQNLKELDHPLNKQKKEENLNR